MAAYSGFVDLDWLPGRVICCRGLAPYVPGACHLPGVIIVAGEVLPWTAAVVIRHRTIGGGAGSRFIACGGSHPHC
jgi:hypothetical protein